MRARQLRRNSARCRSIGSREVLRVFAVPVLAVTGSDVRRPADSIHRLRPLARLWQRS